MPKDAYYFSHDYNARNDKKIAALVREYKSSGYGIFWATCEMMHEEGGHLEFDDLTIDAIAGDLNEDGQFVKDVLNKCVDKYKLFVKDDILLQSSRVHRNLETKNEKRTVKADAGRLGGIKSGESRRNKIEAKQNEAVLQAASSNEPKESKVKEIKESKETLVEPENNFKKKHFEEMIIQEMMKTWKTHNPSYYEEPELDYSACLEIAYKIAKMKKWRKEEVLNGKMPETLMSWGKIVVFVKYDSFLKKLSISNLNSQWQNLVQKMTAPPDEPKFQVETPTPTIKHESQVDFEKYKRK